MYGGSILYAFTRSSNNAAISVCFANQPFLYEHVYDPITWATTAYKTYTGRYFNDLIKVDM